MRLLVIQHIACEPPGAFEEEMRERRIDFDRVQIDEGQTLPSWHAYDGIVAMGGPMSANDDQSLPWLAHEKREIAAAVLAGLPYWGICLGAQLLAAALGARVHRGARPELGIHDDVMLSAVARKDPVFNGLPSPLLTFQWHGETFELPRGAVLLASSRAYPHQAFRVGRAYGLQFHLEVSTPLARSWLTLPAYAAELQAAQGPQALATLSAKLDCLQEVVPLAKRLFGRWIDEVVAPTGAPGREGGALGPPGDRASRQAQ